MLIDDELALFVLGERREPRKVSFLKHFHCNCNGNLKLFGVQRRRQSVSLKVH